ncbi:hypothetical protein HDK77DRAFT_485420 [Phyllosticta capitalensis]
MAPIPSSSADTVTNVMGVVVNCIGVLLATGFAWAGLSAQRQQLKILRSSGLQLSERQQG